MQYFPCPFCGPRPETEFTFVTEAGKPRPEPAAEVSDAQWAAYLHLNHAPKGRSEEIWLHLTCGDYFWMARDTVTRDVLDTRPLNGETP